MAMSMAPGFVSDKMKRAAFQQTASQQSELAQMHQKKDGIALLRREVKGPRDGGKVKNVAYITSAYDRHRPREDYERDEEKGYGGNDDSDSGVDSDDSLLDDPELDGLRAKRMAAMRGASEKASECKASGCGSYEEVTEEEFLPTVTKDGVCIVHFFAPAFERCKIMDMHLRKLAPLHKRTRFISINAEKAPFFIDKLGVQTLPTIVFFLNGVTNPDERLNGFEDLAGGDSFKTRTLEEALTSRGVLPESFCPEDSDDEEEDEDNYNDKGTGKKQWSERGGIYGFGRTRGGDDGIDDE